MKIHRLEKEGDGLCFLTGQDEVRLQLSEDPPTREGSRWAVLPYRAG